MAQSNRERIDRGLVILAEPLVGFVDRHLNAALPAGQDWLGVMGKREGQSYDNRQDPSLLFRVILDNWRDAFQKFLSPAARNYVGELRDVRNRLYHHNPINAADTLRALDTMQRLATEIGAPAAANQLDRMRFDLQRQTYEEESRRAQKTVAVTPDASAYGVKPWREVIAPHRDVAQGNFSASEYAANLAQVARGEGELEYTDAVEFFRHTFLTEGLRDLLVKAAKRISGNLNAPPVINLQTNFGGGKTHSLLAVYHLFSGHRLLEFPQEVQELLGRTGADGDPGELAKAVEQRVTRAVLVGTEIAPDQPWRKADGTEVRTLWGELAWQLGGTAAYDRIAQADASATNPGGMLQRIIADAAPCVILIDEWVAYARQLYGLDGLAGGSFDTHFTFAQALCDAVQAVPGALLVVSIPASARDDDRPGVTDIEIGGINGREALVRLQNVIRRVADHWRPANAGESFEIVRRRLFDRPDGDALREIAAIARRFGDYYRENLGELPRECREASYEARIRAAYPIHPELFDRLYQDWSTLERFQRTRGVLRLMSKVIHHLWISPDASPLIMPGSIPLDIAEVRGEISQYVEDTWTPVLETDVDGRDSTPGRIDRERTLYGNRALTRRIARTIFMGSAPTLRSAHKGIDEQRIRLGVAVPGDSIGHIRSALGLLADRASYLYSEADRYWYDTQPSVTRIAREHAEWLQERPADVHEQIVRRLQGHAVKAHRGAFAAVHAAPEGTGDVTDSEEVRLALLHPAQPYDRNTADCPALVSGRELVRTCGSAQRRNRNLIVLLAADLRRLPDLEAAVREYLAWKHIVDRTEDLALSGAQAKQAVTRREQANHTVDLRLCDTYIWVLAPRQPQGSRDWQLEASKVSESGDWLAERASRRLVATGDLVATYGPNRLGQELRNPAKLGATWQQRGHVSFGELWRYHCEYPYLPRLRDREVLVHCVEDGLTLLTWEQEGFAFADAYDHEAGHYEGLVLPSGDAHVQVSDALLLVRPDLAVRQYQQDQAHAAQRLRQVTATGGEAASAVETRPASSPAPDLEAEPAPATPRTFFGAVDVDVDRAGRRLSEIVEDVVAQLTRSGATVKLTLEIHAEQTNGLPDDIRNVVKENTTALGFRTAHFE